jgi:hypothetical protein
MALFREVFCGALIWDYWQSHKCREPWQEAFGMEAQELTGMQDELAFVMWGANRAQRRREHPCPRCDTFWDASGGECIIGKK